VHEKLISIKVTKHWAYPFNRTRKQLCDNEKRETSIVLWIYKDNHLCSV